MDLNNLKLEFHLAELTARLKFDDSKRRKSIYNSNIKNYFDYKKTAFKSNNCMIRRMYEWKRYDLVDKLCNIDNNAYIYLLKRLIDIRHTNNFFYYFNKFNINWNNHLNIITWLSIYVLKQNNFKIFKYFIENFKINILDEKFLYIICKYCHQGKCFDYIKDHFIIPNNFKNVSSNELLRNLLICKFNGDIIGERFFKLVYDKKNEEQLNSLKLLFLKNI